ncbi:Rieske domain-containing protein [Seminavis robusta]|uniref:Rieske domain-containing protein n=1 Tax=Seminavis robusta TaxID=568900 RepID=A0A9N8DP91_9STRA|nr:Rieske domain-containing protein [Seminavis robusta]|eukprot:Sro249_g098780.1 Rieske domain-containing protein (163) ;mRNA; f:58562-59050
MSDDSAAAVDVGASSDFPEGKGCQVDVKGRPLSIFRKDGTLYALDLHCYHMGGPLSMGDIEDLTLPEKGESVVHPCVVCPWHKYKISLKTGEGIYVQSDPFAAGGGNKQVKSRGRKQRTHPILEDSDGRVKVQLNLSTDTKFESDYYATEEMKELLARQKKG